MSQHILILQRLNEKDAVFTDGRGTYVTVGEQFAGEYENERELSVILSRQPSDTPEMVQDDE